MMVGLLLTAVFASFISSSSFPVLPIREALMFLEKYSYLEISPEKEEPKMHDEIVFISKQQFKKALTKFQRFTGIQESGILDVATLTMMRAPRCGVSDIMYDYSDTTRKKRYAHLDRTWNKTALTYRISKLPTHVRDPLAAKREISEAFEVWSAVTPLTFEEKQNGSVDIEICFVQRDHGDGRRNSFDGPGMVVAHAFPPENGDIHFDDEETWTTEGDLGKGANVFQTAVHEFGHSLGLDHTEQPNATMYPYYRGYKPSYTLHRDDIEGIQAHYGGPPVPDLCNDSSIDTITRTAEGATYVFRGIFYWELLNESGFAKGYPRRIAHDWDGLPDDLDASLYWSDGKTFFFKERWYWKYTNKVKEPGYPKLVRDGFPHMPESPDAAFVWKGNGLTYFFKGDKYWRLPKRSIPGKYGHPIKNFKGIPRDVDAAFQSQTGLSYVFKRDRYYKLGNKRLEAVPESRHGSHRPYSTAERWFAC